MKGKCEDLPNADECSNIIFKENIESEDESPFERILTDIFKTKEREESKSFILPLSFSGHSEMEIEDDGSVSEQQSYDVQSFLKSLEARNAYRNGKDLDSAQFLTPHIPSKFLSRPKSSQKVNRQPPNAYDIPQTSISYLPLILKSLVSFKPMGPAPEKKYVDATYQWHAPASHSNYTLKLKFHGELMTGDSPCLFILAKNGKKAYIPDDPKVRIILVLTELQWQDNALVSLIADLKRTANRIEFLIYSSPTPTLEETISNSNWRRLAVFIFAYNSQLKDFMMMDDDVASLQFNREIVDEYFFERPSLLNEVSLSDKKTLKPLDWQVAYLYFKMRAWDVFFLSMDCLQGKPCALSSGVLFFNSEAIFQLLEKQFAGNISVLFPGIEHAKLPLDDFYMQYGLFYLHVLYHRGTLFIDDNEQIDTMMYVPAFKMHLAKSEVTYLRASEKKRQQTTLKTQSVSTCAEGWINAEEAIPSLIFSAETKEEQACEQFRQFILKRMHHAVLAAKKRHEEKRMAVVFEETIEKYFLQNHIKDLQTSQDRDYLSKKMEDLFQKLRRHQREAVARGTLPTNNKYPTYKLPTGSGKTLVQSYLAMFYYLQGKNVFIVTPFQNLVEQFYQAFLSEFSEQQAADGQILTGNASRALLPVIRVMSKQRSLTMEMFAESFPVIQSLKKNYIFIFCLDSYVKFLKTLQVQPIEADISGSEDTFKAIQIFDEAHCMFKPKYSGESDLQNLMLQMAEKFHKNLLFSATPFKQSKEVKHRFKYKMAEAIEEKILPPVAVRPINWGKRNKVEDALLWEIVCKEPGEGMIYASSIAECDRLALMLQHKFEKEKRKARQIVVVHSKMNAAEEPDDVDGSHKKHKRTRHTTERVAVNVKLGGELAQQEMSQNERSDWMVQLRQPCNGRIIISCNMLIMGFDSPYIDWIADVVPRQKHQAWLSVQIQGRLARMRSGAFESTQKTFYPHMESNLYKIFKQAKHVNRVERAQGEPTIDSRKFYDVKISHYFGEFFRNTLEPEEDENVNQRRPWEQGDFDQSAVLSDGEEIEKPPRKQVHLNPKLPPLLVPNSVDTIPSERIVCETQTQIEAISEAGLRKRNSNEQGFFGHWIEAPQEERVFDQEEILKLQ